MNKATVRIKVKADKRESDAIFNALSLEAGSKKAGFGLSKSKECIILTSKGTTLGDARAFASSSLRLLKAVLESIRAVE